ncbi:MAG TPA: dTDP-4-dehydrorhamnose reductase [Anaerovoracaceae bacterium]|nr:dTDP-4-dehydrorhamnose reductase [Anaerovoracaceae bacterium]
MKRLRILLLGKNGQLGWEAERQLFCYGDVFAYDFPEIDFMKPETVLPLIDKIKPDLIYNAVAYTNVDKAEQEPENVGLINAVTPGLIAEKCMNQNIPLVHISTDYVFDGKKGQDYTEEDEPNPINVYGCTKLDGERNVIQSGCDYLIFRTSWVYSMRTGGFLQKVIEWAQKNEELRIVNDQVGNPTWARTLAILSISILPLLSGDLKNFFQQNKGVYHLAGGGSASRFDWTRFILENLPNHVPAVVKSVIPAKTTDFPSPANRPPHSALNCDLFEKKFHLNIPGWKESLSLAING